MQTTTATKRAKTTVEVLMAYLEQGPCSSTMTRTEREADCRRRDREGRKVRALALQVLGLDVETCADDRYCSTTTELVRRALGLA